MSTSSAIPENLYEYSRTAVAADDDLRNWVNANLRPAIAAFVQGAAPKDAGQNIDISSLSSWTGGFSASNSIDQRIANETNVLHNTDAHVREVGEAFEKAGRGSPLPGLAGPPAKDLLGRATGTYYLDDLELDEQLDPNHWEHLKVIATTSGDVKARDKANRELLQHDLDELRKQLPDLSPTELAWAQGHPPPAMPGAHGGFQAPPREPENVKLYKSIQNKISELEGIQKALAVNPGTPHYLLMYSTDGENGRAAIATGDPFAKTTKNVVTGVYGMTTKVSTMDGDVKNGDKVYDKANGLDPGNPTAVVTWYGYDAPPLFLEGHPDVFMTDRAAKGAPDLAKFQAELARLHQGGPAHMTVIAHSYGGVVTGLAAKQPGGLKADDVYYVGSVGTDPDGVTALLKQGTHVYASRQPWDVALYTDKALGLLSPAAKLWSQAVGRGDPTPVGSDPTTLPGVTHLDLQDGAVPRYRVDERHTEYWDHPQSLTYMGQIATGQPPQYYQTTEPPPPGLPQPKQPEHVA